MPKAFRFGWGEYQPAGVNQMGRLVFMDTVLRQAPHVFDALLTIEDQLTAGVEDRIESWGRTWHLSDRWLLAIARETLQARREIESYRDRREWIFPGWSVIAPDWPDLGWDPDADTRTLEGAPGGAGWDPTIETLEAFHARVERYILRIQQLTADAGFERVPEKKTTKHFDWLVQFQVCGYTHADIAEACGPEGVEVARIGEAITPLARSIGLTLRPDGRHGPRQR